MSGRLTVRFGRAYQEWIAQLGGDQADAVRALMVLGAASLGLPGAQREALRLLEADLPIEVGAALLALADKRQTSGSHTRGAADRATRRARDRSVYGGGCRGVTLLPGSRSTSTTKPLRFVRAKSQGLCCVFRIE